MQSLAAEWSSTATRRSKDSSVSCCPFVFWDGGVGYVLLGRQKVGEEERNGRRRQQSTAVCGNLIGEDTKQAWGLPDVTCSPEKVFAGKTGFAGSLLLPEKRCFWPPQSTTMEVVVALGTVYDELIDLSP